MNYQLIIENFLEVLASEKGLAANTRNSYKNDIDQFFSTIKKSIFSIKELNSNHIEKHIKLLKEKGLEKNSISRKISAIDPTASFSSITETGS